MGTTLSSAQRHRSADWWIAGLMAVTAAALLALGTLAGMNVDEDELGTSVLMTMLQAQAVWHGHLPFWSSRLGFGLPHPGAESFFVHPLMPLFAAWDPYTAVMALYAAHIVVGGLGFWWLCRTLKLSPITTGVCTATFLLSSPSLQYTMTAFYPTYFVAWTLAPLVLGLIIRLLDDPQPSLRIAIGLGVAAGLMLSDGHLGHAPFLLGTIVFGVVACPRRAGARRGPLTLAAIIALAIGGYHVGTTLDEYLRFPAGLPRWDDETLTAAGLWDTFLRPLEPELVGSLFDGQPWHPARFLLQRGSHVVFFGGPFALLAIAALARPGRTHPWRPLLLLSAGTSMLLMILSSRWRLGPISATYLLRDAVVIGGIGLAGIALDRIGETSPRRLAFNAIVAAQFVVVSASAVPFVIRSLAAGQSFRRGGSDAVMRSLAERLASPTRRDNGRVYLTAGPGTWERWGIDRPNLWYTRLTHAGVRAVNGLFKGISTQSLTPSFALPYGSVDSNPALSMSAPSLTVLGIRSVVALDSEPTAPGLEQLESWPTSKGRLRLLDNAQAWPGAHFVSQRAFADELPVQPGCPHDGLLCRNLAPVLAAAEETVSAVRYDEGTITIAFAPATRERVLLVTEMFREGWYARVDGGQRPVTAAWHALMKVDVAAGASSVELRYRPVWRLALAAFSWAVTVVAALLAMSPWPLKERAK